MTPRSKGRSRRPQTGDGSGLVRRGPRRWLLLKLGLSLSLWGGMAWGQSAAPDEAFSRGVELLRAERYTEAETVFKNLLDQGGAAPFLYHNLGIVYQRQGLQEKAVEQFRRALELDSQFHPARVLLGAGLIALGQVEAGLRELDQAVNALPEEPLLRLELARAYQQAGRPLQALKQFRRLAREDPGNAEYRYQLGGAYVEVVRWCYSEMQRIAPTSARVWQAQAQNQIALHDYPGAAQSLEQAIQTAPGMPDLHLLLAQIYARQGRLLEAIRALDEELKRMPTNQGAQQLRQSLVERISTAAPQP